MEIKIGKAVKEDMPQVLELIKELARFENEPNAVTIGIEELEKEGFGSNPLFTCFVAKIDTEMVGIALVYFRFSTWKGRTVHLEDLIVKESMRGKNIGSLLFKEVMKYGKEQGVKRVEWVVLNWNKGAIKFYERSGAQVDKEWYLVQMNEDGIDNYIENN